MEPRSGTRRKLKPRCIVNYLTSRCTGRALTTDAYEGLADTLLPEFLRLQLNNQARVGARRTRLPDLYPQGITWAEASALRQHFNAVVNGDTRSATEVREAVEGRATQRIEVNKTNDRLKQLLEEYRYARMNPPPKSDSAAGPANGESET